MPRSPSSICRLATGRSALLHLIGRLSREGAKTVLLPCYLAEGIIQPFLKSGFTIKFYRLQSDLSPMTEDLGAILGQVKGAAIVVLIHYFGFPVRSPELDSVLAAYSPIVVDDLAHAPFATTALGRPLVEIAQVALFSLNKFLPVGDGAILISNRSDIDVSMDEGELDELPKHVQQAYRDHLQSALALFDSTDPVQAKELLSDVGNAYETYYAAINSDLSPFRQSAHSRRVEESFPFESLIERRSANSRILYEWLDSPVFSLVHQVLPDRSVPFCIPARVNAARRREIIETLLDKGILLSTLQDKWDFIPENQRHQYPVEAAFLDEHVLIPVSEFIATESMRGMVAQLNGLQMNYR